MTIARSIRVLLAFVTGCIVVWSFVSVGHRLISEHSENGQGQITLTLLHWGDKAEDVIVRDLIDSYEKLHPNVRILRVNPGYNQFLPKMKTMMAAGTPPDIFYLPPSALPQMADLKLVRPVDDYLEKERASGTAQWLDDFWPILIKAWRYDSKTGLVGSGPLYGLPKDSTTCVMYINVNLFEKAGIDWRTIQRDGWTWDQYADVCRKIRALNGTPDFAGRTIYGGVLEIWSDTLRNVLWTFGGDFFGTNPDGTPNFRDIQLDSPQCQEAMNFIRRLRLEEKTVFNATGVAKDGFQEFLGGNIGIEGPVGCWRMPRFMEGVDFRWDCVPVPYKEKQYQASQIFYTAWSMSTGTPYPDQCFDLIKFLCGPEGAKQQARAQLAIPPLISVAKSKDFLEPPGVQPHDNQIFLDAFSYARLAQVPREPEWPQIVDDESAAALQLGQTDTMTVARNIKARWLNLIDSPLRRREWRPMRWDLVILATIAVLLAAVTALTWKARRERLGPLDRAQERAGFLFISPWLIGFLALTLGPMLVSLLLSFTRWSALTPIGSAESVGTANYRQLLSADPVFFQSLRVTFYFVLLAVPVTQIAALAVAILMNTRVRGITVFRTIYFVPSVVSGVALAVLWRQIFNNDYGVMNAMLRPIASIFGTTPPDWFGRDAHRWAIPAFVIMGLWGVGSGMILYLAGLKGIPQSMYEAATIDGAGAARRLWNVTLPMLSPLIFYNVVMGIIGSFQVFTQAMVMTNGGPNNATLFYVLDLYRQAFEFHQMGYGSAMAWVLFVIVLALTILIFRGSKNLVYSEGLKT